MRYWEELFLPITPHLRPSGALSLAISAGTWNQEGLDQSRRYFDGLAVPMALEDDDFPVAYLFYVIGATVVLAAIAVSSFFVLLR